MHMDIVVVFLNVSILSFHPHENKNEKKNRTFLLWKNDFRG